MSNDIRGRHSLPERLMALLAVDRAPVLPAQFQQGPVLLLEVNEIPPDAKPVDDRALRPTDGDEHQRYFKSGATLFRSETGQEYVLVFSGPALLKHLMHQDVPVPSGKYRVIHQREYLGYAFGGETLVGIK
jgi:hypothetical protein